MLFRSDAASQPRIIELISKPAEAVKPWYAYRDHFLTQERIDAGVEFWSGHRVEIETAAKKSGVAPHVIVGILGAETYFGRITGKYRVVDALATLAFDYPPRAGYFRAELEQFLLLGFGTSGTDLQKSYTPVYKGREKVDGEDAVRLDLTPKAAGVASKLTRIELWLSPTTWQPVQQKFYEPSKDYLIARYRNLQLNTKIPSKSLQLQLRGNVKTVKH